MRKVISRTLSLPVHLEGKRYWSSWEENCERKSHLRGNGRVAKKSVELDFARFSPSDYLLSWVTAVAGVELEEDKHTIVTPHIKFVNQNGNSWSNPLLLESYHTFILAENFVEHISIPEMSKGKVLDAVAWVVEKHFNGYKEPVPTVFVDCLIATNRKKHPRLVKNILSGVMNQVSMGTDILYSQCSKCGKIFEEGVDESCNHIQEHLRRFYQDKKGIRRIISELCGVAGISGSNIFKELSWVTLPAFMWAKLHGFIDYSNDSTGRPVRAIVPISRIRESTRE